MLLDQMAQILIKWVIYPPFYSSFFDSFCAEVHHVTL